MKLAAAHQLTLLDSTLISALPVLNEAGEGPRWSFNYDNHQQDPSPDILVLGAYRHPSTGNNLVGGVNLNYLDKNQRDDLARVLPQLMQQSNLYQRYHLGKQLLPDVFGNSYRTYNAEHIRGINKGVFHPKYGMMQATTDFLKKKIGGMFKSKAQRAKDAAPKFPQDLSGMQDTLDQAVKNLGLQVAKGETEPDSPEVAAANQNFMQLKLDRNKSMADIERDEDAPLVQATQNFQQTQLQNNKATPRQVGPYANQQVQQYQSIPAQPTQQMTPQQMGQTIERERAQNQAELTDPNNSLDLDGDGVADDQEVPFSEAIVYFCPRSKRYIMEEFDTQSVGEKWREEMLQRRYINPDDLYQGSFEWTFIYTDGNKLYVKPGDDESESTHANLIGENPDLYERYMKLFKTDDLSRMRSRSESCDLVGRLGHVKLGYYDKLQIISFWNGRAELYDELLVKCLTALKAYMTPGSEESTFVSTPVHGNVPISDFMSERKTSEQPAVVAQDDVELYRNLHLMRGAEKQSAMKKLGVGGGGKPHPMARAMTDAGLLKPGQKWWAPTSEGTLREPCSSGS